MGKIGDGLIDQSLRLLLLSRTHQPLGELSPHRISRPSRWSALRKERRSLFGFALRQCRQVIGPELCKEIVSRFSGRFAQGGGRFRPLLCQLDGLFRIKPDQIGQEPIGRRGRLLVSLRGLGAASRSTKVAGDGFDDLGGSRSVELDPELDELVYMLDRKGLEATGQLCRFSQRLARVLQLLQVDVKPVSNALQLLVAAAPVLLGRGGW